MTNRHLDELDRILRVALTGFVDQVHLRRWRGRELDCVSLFALHLGGTAAAGTALFDRFQVAVGALVPGVEGMNLGRHLKTGQSSTGQNRPTAAARMS